MKQYQYDILKRQEKKQEKQMKSVRINAKTVIFVSKDITDEEAIRNYWLKRGEKNRKQEHLFSIS